MNYENLVRSDDTKKKKICKALEITEPSLKVKGQINSIKMRNANAYTVIHLNTKYS